jgi:lysophospholipase L1-like esterase
MGVRRLGWVLAGALALGCLLVGCSSTKASVIVALGDSVPRGNNCDCTPYPGLTAEDLKRKGANDSVSGATTSTVLTQLTSDKKVIDDVRHAQVVEIEIGANDVGYSSKCDVDVECYAPKVPTLEKNLASIVERVRELAPRHALVVLLDYWSVWLGGSYADAHGEAYVDAAAEVTAQVDAVVKSIAASTGSGYVDLRAAFMGPDYSYDETHYLSDDGDHPNAAGHRQIATATEKVIAAH